MCSSVVVTRIIASVFVLSLACRAVSGNDVIDHFESVDAWEIILADGVKGEIVEEDGVLRLDYDFTAGAGYCVVRRPVDIEIDPNYRFSFRFRGSGPENTLEFKLIDETDENVWWSVRRDMRFPDEWEHLSIRRRHVSFAWGPSGGSPLERVRAIEFAVTASRGGKGSIWLDDLRYERLPEIEPAPTEPTAESTGRSLSRVSPDGTVRWDAAAGSPLLLTFDHAVEFGVIELEWDRIDRSSHYRIDVSPDARMFRHLAQVTGSDGGTDVVFSPETEAKSVRITMPQGRGVLRAIRFLPVDEIVGPNDYAQLLANRAPPGAFPKYYRELSAWTVVGLPGSDNEALVSDTGAIEPVKGGGTLEPFIVRSGGAESWADASIEHRLEGGSLPIPSVRWSLDGLTLDITVLVTELSGTDAAVARYTVTNTSDAPESLELALAARPFQVLSAAQFLNIVGGAVRTNSAHAEPRSIRLDDRLFARLLTPADRVVATDLASGLLIDRLKESTGVSSTFREAVQTGSFASAAMVHLMTLRPDETQSIVVVMPMQPERADHPIAWSGIESFGALLDRERSRWTESLSRTEILVPDDADHLRHAIRANLAYTLINADGPRIQPGSRTYERSWIRDGAMTSAALLALGHDRKARDFIDWYAPYQYANGKVPCVVDHRGPDPVDENDAPGQFIFAIRNSAEASGGFDELFARAMYPRVRATVDYIQDMRNRRLTEEFTASDDPILRACAGLMPESISHEGYSEKPMHSHWDNFWVYRGLRDAAALAERLGEKADRDRFSTLADAFGRSIVASIDATASIHGINYVPGCVELGDFDATSTSIAFYPTEASGVVDRQLLVNTFERAWQATKHRIKGGAWDGMTPYEIRTVGTFIRLGWIDRAYAYLDWLFERQDPMGWSQWGEIAYKDHTLSRFVGDMPHTWVGSGAILSILSLFAYEEGDTMVLAAGVPARWLESGDSVGVLSQRTRFGSLGYTIQRANHGLVIRLEGGCTPPRGFRIDVRRLCPFIDGSEREDAWSITADGAEIEFAPGGDLIVPVHTREVRIRAKD
ncbi:MAG: hypothetical protein AAGA55_06355 [Planctomycetota bacterium]